MYPSTIYSQGNPTENTFLDDSGFFLDVIIGYLNDNVIAIETKLGVDGSAIATSIDYLLKNPLSINPGHKHTTASINFTADQNFVTAAQLVVIGNTSNTNTGDETATRIGALIGGADDATPNDTDFVATSLTAAGILKKITWTNVKAFLKTYFDSLTQTLTNKRIEPRLITAASYTTDTGTSLTVATADVFQVTAQAGALKFNNPGGTPVAGQKLIIRIKDDGTARALTYDTQFRASSDLALPSTTVLGKTLYMGFIFNLTDTKWDLLAVLNNF